MSKPEKEEFVRKINPYMLEDPMYQYMAVKKEKMKKERIDQLKSLLDEASSDEDDVKKTKKKAKKKDKKKSKKKSKKKDKKKSKRKNKEKFSSTSDSSSDSDEDSIDKKKKKNTDSNKRSKSKASKRKASDSDSSSDSEVSRKKHKVDKGGSDKDKSPNKIDAKARSSDSNHRLRPNVNDRKPSRDRDRSRSHHRGRSHSKDRDKRDHRSRSPHVHDKHQKYDRHDSRKRESPKHQSEVDRLIAKERAARSQGQVKEKKEKEKDKEEVDRLIAKAREQMKNERRPDNTIKQHNGSDTDTQELTNASKSSAQATWDAYIDNLIQQSEDQQHQAHISRACIIALEGGVRWTSDNHPLAMKPSIPEATLISGCFREKHFKPFMENGMVIEGKHYKFIGADFKNFKTVLCNKEGHGGLSLHRSKTAIIVAENLEKHIQSHAYRGTRLIAEYLEDKNL